MTTEELVWHRELQFLRASHYLRGKRGSRYIGRRFRKLRAAQKQLEAEQAEEHESEE